eukprot:gene11231-23482_t
MGGCIQSSSFNVDRMVTDDDRKSFQGVDKFLRLALLQMHQDEAIKIVIGNILGLNAFAQFLAMKLLSTHNYMLGDLPIVTATKFPSCYQLTNDLKIFLSKFPLAFDDTQISPTVAIFVQSLFMDYLISNFFEQWRYTEANNIVNLCNQIMSTNSTLPELEIMKSSSSFLSKTTLAIANSASLDDHYIESSYINTTSNMNNISLEQEYGAPTTTINATIVSLSNYNNISHSFEQILKSCDSIEIKRLIQSNYWLVIFIAAVENLPIGITISSLSPERPGYPILYANKHYEEKSGQLRTDIIGEKFALMQRPGTAYLPEEKNRLTTLLSAIENQQPCLTVLKCHTGPSSSFRTIIAVKPIIDTGGRGKYMIALQMEVTMKQNIENSALNFTSLIASLPGSVTA